MIAPGMPVPHPHFGPSGQRATTGLPVSGPPAGQSHARGKGESSTLTRPSPKACTDLYHAQ